MDNISEKRELNEDEIAKVKPTSKDDSSGLLRNIKRCPNCHSNQVRFRRLQNNFCCQLCGTISKADELISTKEAIGSEKKIYT